MDDLSISGEERSVAVEAVATIWAPGGAVLGGQQGASCLTSEVGYQMVALNDVTNKRKKVDNSNMKNLW